MAFMTRNFRAASGGGMKSGCRLAGRPTISYSMLAARSVATPVLTMVSENVTIPAIFSMGLESIEPPFGNGYRNSGFRILFQPNAEGKRRGPPRPSQPTVRQPLFINWTYLPFLALFSRTTLARENRRGNYPNYQSAVKTLRGKV